MYTYLYYYIISNTIYYFNKKENNDITVVSKEVTDAKTRFIDCDILNTDSDNRVISIGKNIGIEDKARINMEMYIMKTSLFESIIYESIRTGIHRKVKGYINSNLHNLNVATYDFKGYLSCVNSTKQYFDTNLEFLNEKVNEELFYNQNPIYTKSQDEPPTKYTEDSKITNSIIANGSYIEGEVENCIIGRRVVIGKGAKVKNCAFEFLSQ